MEVSPKIEYATPKGSPISYIFYLLISFPAQISTKLQQFTFSLIEQPADAINVFINTTVHRHGHHASYTKA